MKRKSKLLLSKIMYGVVVMASFSYFLFSVSVYKILRFALSFKGGFHRHATSFK